MITCRLLCALLVLALCCCSSVCVTELSLKPPLLPRRPRHDHNQNHLLRPRPTTTKPPTTTTTTTTKHQALRLQRPSCVDHPRTVTLREIDGSLSNSAWVCAPLCSLRPRWRTPLWL
ncbi:mucin, putative, partial [Trypanosoma cruzi]